MMTREQFLALKPGDRFTHRSGFHPAEFHTVVKVESDEGGFMVETKDHGGEDGWFSSHGDMNDLWLGHVRPEGVKFTDERDIPSPEEVTAEFDRIEQACEEAVEQRSGTLYWSDEDTWRCLESVVNDFTDYLKQKGIMA